jgi:hypothetical protein
MLPELPELFSLAVRLEDSAIRAPRPRPASGHPTQSFSYRTRTKVASVIPMQDPKLPEHEAPRLFSSRCWANEAGLNR